MHPNCLSRMGQTVYGNIYLALLAKKHPFCITIMSIILTIVAVTKIATILFLNRNLLPFTVPYISSSFGKHNFKHMHYPVQIIIIDLSMFYLGNNSKNISLIPKTTFNIKISHATVSNWCIKIAPMFDDMRIQFIPLIDLNSDETVVKIASIKFYIWFIIDSETRFVIGFHLSTHSDSPQLVQNKAFLLLKVSTI